MKKLFLILALILCSFTTVQQVSSNLFTTKELYIIHSALCKYSVYINQENKANRITHVKQSECDTLIIKLKKSIRKSL